MHPQICQIGPFTVYSYGLMMVAAFAIVSVLSTRQAKKQASSPDNIFNLLFAVFVFGIIGARLFYVIENIGYYLKSPLEAIKLQHGGLSWFGGLIAGILTGSVYLRHKKMPIYKTLDLIVPFVALGQAIGRIGCLLNGCCFGRPSEFGIYFKAHQAILVPTQVYSSLMLILVFIILRFFQERPHREGVIFFAYLFLYSVKRFIIEFWRADNQVILLGLTLFQLISIAVFCFSVLGLLSISKTRE